MKHRFSPRRIALVFVSSVLYLIFFQVFYNLLKFDEAFPDDGFSAIVRSLLLNFIPVVVSILINYLIIFSKWNFRQYAMKILVDAALSIVAWRLVDEFFLIVARCFDPDINLDKVGTLLNSILVFMAVETLYYVLRSKQSFEEKERAQRELIRYQYNTLKEQVNPHFLFNSLNILYSLIDVDTQKSKQFILSLSQIYRYIATHQNSQTVTLIEEDDFLRSYVDILEMRYKNQFKVERYYDVPLEGHNIIPYTLQILIENVIKHNIISTRNPMVVTIRACDNYIVVSNPIRLKENVDKSGIGLKYVAEQYKYHGKYFVVDNDGINFTAKIPYL